MSDDIGLIDEEEKTKGRSSRMMLVIGVIAGLIVGGAGAWFATSQLMDKPEEAPIEQIVEDEPEEVAEEPLTVVYLYVDRFQAPLLDARGRTVGFVFMDLALEMADGADQSFVSARLPRVQDAFLRAISENGLTVPGTDGVIDYDGVTKFLREAGNKVLKGDYIKNIYINRTLRAPS